ncbi:variant erythrocyte surface antigen-1 beta subunit [Babesia bovis T2Bo]|uniref:variant erythrocyte surface antigen-1 beta subunit n=1 Tax=Babesia bovis T2Bo TaxID=484906 RepID=UPI001C364F85|nr:variant erythrocyte surface antigen-1 beta subunit [Babesia bovis T2Bo]KAG6440027.1 variant erythrocyte surface antigen-1 beta subunit [Babesia bovis T2Bo]
MFVKVSYKFSSTFAGSLCTEVIGTLIDQLALGLQKWVGWEKDKEVCCLKGDNGIGKKCGTGTGCCGGPIGGSHECKQCGTGATANAGKKCYQSAYNKTDALWTTIVNGPTGAGGSGSAGSAVGGKGGSGVAGIPADPVKAAQEVHLLARIFLGSVCLIWSGLSQLGFLTGKNGDRWSKEANLHEVDKGLGSFMAAMGYDLDRLNQESATGKYSLR